VAPNPITPGTCVCEMVAIVSMEISDREPIERVTGPGGDEWRAHLYDLHTEQDVLDHWADNAIRNGVRDVSELDGWADVPRGVVTFSVPTTERFPF
jgi:hypothetical protein